MKTVEADRKFKGNERLIVGSPKKDIISEYVRPKQWQIQYNTVQYIKYKKYLNLPHIKTFPSPAS